MLDSDLAALYGVETRVLNQAVNRNTDRFPEDFMFGLSGVEYENLKSQNVTSSWGGRRKPPNAFTEHGVLMLSSVLNSPAAVQVNIQVIRVFTRLREALLTHKDILLKLEQLDKKITNLGFDVKMHDGEIATIFELIQDIMEAQTKPPATRVPIGFKAKGDNQ